MLSRAPRAVFALWSVRDDELVLLPLALRERRPHGKMVQHDGGGDRDIQGRRARAVLGDVHESVAQAQLLC